MTKLGRNAPCPCGSGAKYKRCCLPAHQAAERERQRLRSEAVSAEDFVAELDELDRLSNSVPQLIAQGRLDEAEAACLELKRLYPDQIDWLQRSAIVCQARGDHKMAAEYYRKAVAFTYTRPNGFDHDSRAWMLDKIRALDPTAPSAEP